MEPNSLEILLLTGQSPHGIIIDYIQPIRPYPNEYIERLFNHTYSPIVQRC